MRQRKGECRCSRVTNLNLVLIQLTSLVSLTPLLFPQADLLHYHLGKGDDLKEAQRPHSLEKGKEDLKKLSALALFIIIKSKLSESDRYVCMYVYIYMDPNSPSLHISIDVV